MLYFGHNKLLDLFYKEIALKVSREFLDMEPIEELFEENFNKLSKHLINYNLSYKFMEKHFFELDALQACRGNLSVKFVENLIIHHSNDIYWATLSKNKYLPVEFFEKHLEYVRWEHITRNVNLPEEFFEKHIDKIYPGVIIDLLIIWII